MTAAPLSAGGVGIKTWIGFVAMAVGMFLAILDTQIVASSLPEIQTGVGISLNQFGGGLSFDFSPLPTDGVSRVEVVRGSQSALRSTRQIQKRFTRRDPRGT